MSEPATIHFGIDRASTLPLHNQIYRLLKYNASAAFALHDHETRATAARTHPAASRHPPPLPARGAERRCDAVRLDAFPDGDISRVRLIGTVEPDALAEARIRWRDSLPKN